jgi:hypothetical protein
MTDSQDRQNKNALFNSPVTSIPIKQALESELGIEIPVASVPIPSMGLVYPEGHPFHKQEEVQIYGMTATDENILTSPALIKKGTVMNELMKRCLVDKKVDPNSLISGDRAAILYSIRSTGYGAEYPVKVKCPECETENNVDINIGDFNLKELTVDGGLVQVRAFENLFSFQLPVSKRQVHFKLMTGEDENRMIQASESRKKAGIKSDTTITERWMNTIVSINDLSDRATISKFVQNMSAGDSLALRKHIDANQPNVDTSFKFSCESCEHEEVLQVPIGLDFFWPDTAR